ncbi:hypothetical protein [Salinimicrobium sp. TH3]|uniref:hypothetical protein n=1 Tax=Salinimicrobium sp. TH3 TaxID=2997342 RepID=UPI002272CFDB|nr:hypothetical protein [Salinimicrobium sp. TH3]MCY2685938.1 hypothetical protein [Salinimicrobium sp. TH3]
MKHTRFFYRIEKISHRPTEEDVITVINEIKENDLSMSRIVATRIYLDELLNLRGKYSPDSYTSYDLKKGMGFNVRLLLFDTKDEEVYVVESSMEKTKPAVEVQKEEEREIFKALGLDDSILKI